ncbi:MAG: DOMON-like domain-containing protein [Pseudomonadota bacterium]
MPTLKLLPHPDYPAPAVTALEVEAAFTHDGGLSLAYLLTADLAQLRIPESVQPARADGLWRHTCLEVFVQADRGPGYREFNFSPSGQWQAYVFTAYRDGGLLESVPAPSMSRDDAPGRLVLTCTLPAAALPGGGQLRLGLTAVLEDADGSLSYWSLRHPPGKPDFHHTHGFALTLERP